MRTLVSKPQKVYWEEVVSHKDDVLIEGIDIFKDYLVIEERQSGLTQIKVIEWKTNDSYYIPFDDPAYYASTSSNIEFNTQTLRFYYSSMTTPSSVFDFNMKDQSRKYIMIGSYQTLSNEYRYIDANKPNSDFKLIQKREKNLEYGVYHYEDYFYIL